MTGHKTEYTVMGDDGNEYGPVSARQISQWITEGRLEPKTPVKPTTGGDWIFLQDIKGFAEVFKAGKTPQPAKKVSKSAVVLVIFILLVGAALGAFYYYQQSQAH